MRGIKFYRTRGGKQVVLDVIRSQPVGDRLVIGEDLRTVQLSRTLGPPLCRWMDNGLFEVRCSLPSRREFRLVCYHDDASSTVIVLHAFVKKGRKAPLTDLRLAKKRKSEFEQSQESEGCPSGSQCL